MFIAWIFEKNMLYFNYLLFYKNLKKEKINAITIKIPESIEINAFEIQMIVQQNYLKQANCRLDKLLKLFPLPKSVFY